MELHTVIKNLKNKSIRPKFGLILLFFFCFLNKCELFGLSIYTNYFYSITIQNKSIYPYEGEYHVVLKTGQKESKIQLVLESQTNFNTEFWEIDNEKIKRYFSGDSISLINKRQDSVYYWKLLTTFNIIDVMKYSEKDIPSYVSLSTGKIEIDTAFNFSDNLFIDNDVKITLVIEPKVNKFYYYKQVKNDTLKTAFSLEYKLIKVSTTQKKLNKNDFINLVHNSDFKKLLVTHSMRYTIIDKYLLSPEIDTSIYKLDYLLNLKCWILTRLNSSGEIVETANFYKDTLKVKGKDYFYTYTTINNNQQIERYMELHIWDLLKPNPVFLKHMDSFRNISSPFFLFDKNANTYSKKNTFYVNGEVATNQIKISTDYTETPVELLQIIEIPSVYGAQIMKYTLIDKEINSTLIDQLFNNGLNITESKEKKRQNELMPQEYKIGDDFDLNKLNGIHTNKKDSLKFQLNNNRIYLLDFSYINCFFCIKALPTIKIIEDTFAEFLSVFILDPYDDTPERIKYIENLQQKMGLSQNWFLIDNQYVMEHKINEFPTYLIVNQNGKVAEILKGYGPELKERLMEAIIKHKPK